jgi:hypothetical protein
MSLYIEKIIKPDNAEQRVKQNHNALRKFPESALIQSDGHRSLLDDIHIYKIMLFTIPIILLLPNALPVIRLLFVYLPAPIGYQCNQ